MSTTPIAEQPSDDLTMEQARARGLVIDTLALDRIDVDYLVRDRLLLDEDELTSLMSSLVQRGQQMPIEVTRHPDRDGEFGLISGWRRIQALSKLYSETGDPRFNQVRALIITPETAQDAYVTMIEENEIRVNLSFYERARIALRAVHEGVFATQRDALRGLYGSSTRSKRSKIGTFMVLVDAFDGVLQHPTFISEKLGLSLAREMVRDLGFAERLADTLRKAPSRTAPEEMRLLNRFIQDAQSGPEPTVVIPPVSKRPKTETHAETVGTVKLRFVPEKAKIELAGAEIDEDFYTDLKKWIEDRGSRD